MGKMGMWFPHQMPREYTQASACYYRDAKVSTSESQPEPEDRGISEQKRDRTYATYQHVQVQEPPDISKCSFQ